MILLLLKMQPFSLDNSCVMLLETVTGIDDLVGRVGIPDRLLSGGSQGGDDASCLSPSRV